MYNFTGGAGNPSGYQKPHPTPYNGQQSFQHLSHPPVRSTNQQFHPGGTAQHGLRLPQSAAAPPQACYNCGIFGHWAQNCQEPRRAVPVGAMTSPAPYKRQRTSGPVVTRYTVPTTQTIGHPHNPQSFAPQRGWTHPPTTRNLQQYAGLPTSTSSTLSGPWPQLNPASSLGPRPQTQQRNLQGSSASIAQIPRRTSSISSAGSGVPFQDFPPLPCEQQYSTSPTTTLGLGYSERLSCKTHQESFVQRRASSLSSQPHDNQCRQFEAPDHDVKGEGAEQFWWDELGALDYSKDSYDSGYVVSHPANPVAEPLPSTMRDEDLVARLPIAASLPPGVPISKYFRDLSPEDFARNCLEVSSEEVYGGDPALTMLMNSGETISKNELIVRRREMAVAAENANGAGEESEENDLKEAANPEEARDSEDSCGHHTDGLPTPCQSQESEEERQAREQEQRLAALGVTGFAKPVRTSVRRSIVPAAPASADGPQTLIDSGPAPRFAAHNAFREPRPNPFNESSLEGYKLSGSPSRSLYHASSLQTPPTSACHDTRSEMKDICPRPVSGSGAQSSAASSPTSGKFSHVEAPVEATMETTSTGQENRDEISPLITTDFDWKDEDGSPFNEQTDDLKSRKRSTREFSAEANDGPKRQKDEGHQKDRRKAPKVAAAYSRRW